VASGQSLLAFEAPDSFSLPPTWAPATPDMRNGQPVLDFGDAVIEYTCFAGRMPRHYGGGGITASLMWTATTAISGSVFWATWVERHNGAHDTDSDSFGSMVQASAAANAAGAGCPVYTEIALAPGALDGVLPGDHFRLLIARDPAGGSMIGDAELWSVELRET
jgi:hypothetical protein